MKRPTTPLSRHPRTVARSPPYTIRRDPAAKFTPKASANVRNVDLGAKAAMHPLVTGSNPLTSTHASLDTKVSRTGSQRARCQNITWN